MDPRDKPVDDGSIGGRAGMSRLADNIAHFARILRKAGLPIGTGDILAAVRAVETVGLASRDDLFWSLHATLVRRNEHRALFSQAFELFWRDPKLVQKAMAMLLPQVPIDRPKRDPLPGGRRIADALGLDPKREETGDKTEIEIDAVLTASPDDVLRRKDFEQMTSEELVRAKLAMSRLDLFTEPLPTRRYRTSASAALVDMRRTMRSALRQGGDLMMLEHRERRLKPPPLVVICDISGSMSRYSRMFLHFLHALTGARARRGQRVESFVFGTRLTNITRAIRRRDVDEALAKVAALVEDWAGGTRIASTLHAFNNQWSRRVLAQGAVVLLMTDGLERDGGETLAAEMNRLRRSCRQLVWLNPLLRYDAFEPKAAGIKAMLPYASSFRPLYNLQSLEDLAASLKQNQFRSPGRAP
jgi:uncharacterized protein with von Willebrand factor type A (vWA) domain